ncbi:acyl-CoA N-acyltransferase [Cutaneotrichosporon oleaginosum]|uniref:histone acetyltransferase n=1 Tax=Cutaneotrichosporon oleaginosum TaxID=879819 RepID=A0A0J0XYS8_9TREE|nr:acyl-CoA N-acyltransferase [Cutaneotrichosporon oleaginosum]KLT46212.1 acyl-CoA N-acyltransferase [Cutaneotrichosporon oleaginosum]TXT10219.1 hypothetical protein COLE_04153 [Cutaneotrichosporon oleaginosum]
MTAANTLPHTSALELTGVPEGVRDVVVGRQYLVSRGGVARPARILNSRTAKLGAREVYISFPGEDKRLDAWIPLSAVGDEVVEAGPSRVALPRQDSQNDSHAPGSERSTPEREHDAVTRVRNFEDVRFGEYLVQTWYYSPYPMPEKKEEEGRAPAPRGRKRKSDTNERSAHVLSHGVGQGGEGARGRLWVCDLCFKYMHTRAGWERHTAACAQMQPPGRKAYRRGSYTIWEVDGADAQLYCQNLSLFGKLFIDHKSVFFHVENFLFYVLCDAATSKRDQVMAFFSKEKTSYDDYNLACIVTFPPHQGRGFGKLLIEFSYYLTRGAPSPGTPERPLSDLGLKGYLAFWVAVVLRVCRRLLADAEPVQVKKDVEEGRSLRNRRPADATDEAVVVNGIEMTKRPLVQKGQYTLTTTLEDLARACHLRTDDVQLVLTELGFLSSRRRLLPLQAERGADNDDDDDDDDEADEDELGEWHNVEIVITRDAVDEAWAAWGVRELGVLDEKYCLL